MTTLARTDVFADVIDEMLAALGKFGPQAHLPDGTGGDDRAALADTVRAITEDRASEGTVTWRHVLAEEVAEAFAEEDPDALRAELVQVAAVAARWIAAIDARSGS